MKKLMTLLLLLGACGDDVHNITAPAAPQMPPVPQPAAPPPAPQPRARMIPDDQIFPGVTLAWDPNPETNLGGYKIHYGFATRSYTQKIDVGNVTMAHIPGLAYEKTYYFAATAYNTAGLESDFSNEVVYNTPKQPNNPPLEPRITKVVPAPGNGDHLGHVEIEGGSMGVNYVLQASTDLSTWNDVETFKFLELTEKKTVWVDHDIHGNGSGRMFFRIRWEIGPPSTPQL